MKIERVSGRMEKFLTYHSSKQDQLSDIFRYVDQSCNINEDLLDSVTLKSILDKNELDKTFEKMAMTAALQFPVRTLECRHEIKRSVSGYYSNFISNLFTVSSDFVIWYERNNSHTLEKLLFPASLFHSVTWLLPTRSSTLQAYLLHCFAHRINPVIADT